MKNILLLLCSALFTVNGFAMPLPSERITYKNVDNTSLALHVFYPDYNTQPETSMHDKPYADRPAIVFFFGGGWVTGSPKQFYRQSAYFAELGFVAISAEYRIRNHHQSTPFQALEDAKSAIRWIRTHAHTLGIHPEKIIAVGASAGGHLAAGTAILTDYNDPNDDLTVSSSPNALILLNPVLDTSPQGYGHALVKPHWHTVSPLHNIHAALPPTLILLGDEDKVIPVETARAFQKAMLTNGNLCEVIIYPQQKHGFFNHKKYQETLFEMTRFLKTHRYLNP